jgi:hypothetical protein
MITIPIPVSVRFGHHDPMTCKYGKCNDLLGYYLPKFGFVNIGAHSGKADFMRLSIVDGNDWVDCSHDDVIIEHAD